MTPRTIIHLDLDSFFCSVEELRDPALRGLPIAVGGKPEERGVVASASYAARAYGVRSAMPMHHAVRLCPELLILPPAFERYRAASREVMARLHALTPLVEQLSIDEAFMDVTALEQPGAAVARQLQRTIAEELRLPCSLGVASNKLVAKIANTVGKRAARDACGGTPQAVTVVAPGEEAAFLAPLPASALWGVGPKTAERLSALGIATAGQLAAADPALLTAIFGQHGPELALRAQGIDDRPIVTEHITKSISAEETFARDVWDRAALERELETQAERVARKLAREGIGGRTITLKLRWSDFTTLSRQRTLPAPTDDVAVIAREAIVLLRAVWTRRRAVRLIGLGVSGLGPPVRQLSIWDVLSDGEGEPS